MVKRLVYTSTLDPTRRVEHELVHVDKHGSIYFVVTTTGLEFKIGRDGDVILGAGGNEKRLVPPGPSELKTRHLHERIRKVGVGGVVYS